MASSPPCRRGKEGHNGDVPGAGAFSRTTATGRTSARRFAAAAPVVVVAQEKKKKEAAGGARRGRPGGPGEGRKAKTTRASGLGGAGCRNRAAATAEATGAAAEGQTAFNKARQVAALDWLLLNAPEDRVPVDYRNDAMKARS